MSGMRQGPRECKPKPEKRAPSIIAFAHRSAGGARVLVRAEPEDPSAKLQAQFEDALKWVQGKWEGTEDQEKPAAIAIILGVVVAQIAIGATIDAVDRIPVVNKLLQLVGVAVTGLFAYRYFTDPAERESVKKSVDAFTKSVTGDK
ncbi:hypothetical protein HYH03_016745 [Edaphochlamys debaryana]|uniref:Cyanobacterial aminoacyl-tRNA synthetase CAAD domain-containing protein n=1 Tax=Edaphochlamys debaryana TaxID=47281 RepID=A0A836BPT4_9CHLO|nr:hypothetical protein HYH03_016745 [Edaphochlamys debaryana]|eukprot:KAG2484435.1 hypothetical protein HYH03_016745 [Edaphochlamys debaryana]